MKKKNKKPSILKETNEERLERLKYWTCTRTQVLPNKKKYNRNQFKKEVQYV